MSFNENQRELQRESSAEQAGMLLLKNHGKHTEMPELTLEVTLDETACSDAFVRVKTRPDTYPCEDHQYEFLFIDC